MIIWTLHVRVPSPLSMDVGDARMLEERAKIANTASLQGTYQLSLYSPHSLS